MFSEFAKFEFLADVGNLRVYYELLLDGVTLKYDSIKMSFVETFMAEHAPTELESCFSFCSALIRFKFSTGSLAEYKSSFRG